MEYIWWNGKIKQLVDTEKNPVESNRSTLLENPQYFEPKIKNKPIFSQQRTSTCSHERVNERKTNPTQQITRSHGYTSYLSGD